MRTRRKHRRVYIGGTVQPSISLDSLNNISSITPNSMDIYHQSAVFKQAHDDVVKYSRRHKKHKSLSVDWFVATNDTTYLKPIEISGAILGIVMDFEFANKNQRLFILGANPYSRMLFKNKSDTVNVIDYIFSIGKNGIKHWNFYIDRGHYAIDKDGIIDDNVFNAFEIMQHKCQLRNRNTQCEFPMATIFPIEYSKLDDCAVFKVLIDGVNALLDVVDKFRGYSKADIKLHTALTGAIEKLYSFKYGANVVRLMLLYFYGRETSDTFITCINYYIEGLTKIVNKYRENMSDKVIVAFNKHIKELHKCKQPTIKFFQQWFNKNSILFNDVIDYLVDATLFVHNEWQFMPPTDLEFLQKFLSNADTINISVAYINTRQSLIYLYVLSQYLSHTCKTTIVSQTAINTFNGSIKLSDIKDLMHLTHKSKYIRFDKQFDLFSNLSV